MKTLLFLLLLASCVPSRNPQGKDYPKSGVLDRVLARKDRNRMYSDSGGVGRTIYYQTPK